MKRVCRSRWTFSPEREMKLPYKGKQHAVHFADNGRTQEIERFFLVPAFNDIPRIATA